REEYVRGGKLDKVGSAWTFGNSSSGKGDRGLRRRGFRCGRGNTRVEPGKADGLLKCHAPGFGFGARVDTARTKSKNGVMEAPGVGVILDLAEEGLLSACI